MIGPTHRERVVLWGLSLFWLAAYLLSMRYHSGGWALPLDDSYIYFQYARQAAEGHFLQYNANAAATAGATSLLYMVLLVPGFLVGLEEEAIAFYALALGWLTLGASAWLLMLTGRLAGGEFAGWAAAVLFLLCGPLLWGFYSGMEIGLFSFAILLTLYLYLTGDDRAPYAAALMVLARPEGIVLAVLLVACYAMGRRGDRWDWRWALPLAAYALQASIVYLATGTASAAGVAAKWRFAAPHASPPELVRGVLFDFAEFIKGILTGSLGHQSSVNLYAYDGNYRRMVFAPFVALVFLAELSVRGWDECAARKPGLAAIAGSWFFVGLLASCTLVEFDAHYNRYQQPFLPLFILVVGLGLGRMVREGGAWGRKIGWGFAVFFGSWGVLSAVYFAVAYGENCSDIRRQQIAMAKYIDSTLPADARVAINDAGALRYYGRRETVDLVGLTSAGFATAWRHGSGSVYEALEALPLARRPDYFAIFPNWFGFPDGVFLHPIHRIRVLEPSIIDAEKVLYRANWDPRLHGHTLRDPDLETRGWRIVDQVDVADLASEKRHAYQSAVRVPGTGEANLLLALPGAWGGEGVFMDGGRTVTGGERLRVELEPGKPALILMRTVTGIAQHFAVLANGRRIGTVELPGGRGRKWRELAIGEMRAEAVSGPVVVETVPLHRGGDLRPVVSFHYWFLQP